MGKSGVGDRGKAWYRAIAALATSLSSSVDDGGVEERVLFQGGKVSSVSGLLGGGT